MPRFIQRIASALFSKTPTAEDDSDPGVQAAEQRPEPVDRDSLTRAWFEGRRTNGRDSIDSNPDTARWYRRPRYVVTGAATHRMEHSERPSGHFNG